jgi:isopentenyl diphosphate isomerase/L-lactate dehydrogenase-like FMN-dependent dehydrogenase
LTTGASGGGVVDRFMPMGKTRSSYYRQPHLVARKQDRSCGSSNCYDSRKYAGFQAPLLPSPRPRRSPNTERWVRGVVIMEFSTLHQLFRAGITNLRNRNVGALYQSIHGAGSETTLRRNQAALTLQALRQQTLRDVRNRTIATRFLGHELPTPIMVAPWGAHQVIHESAEVGTAQGAGQNMMALSTATNRPLAEVMAASDGPRMFQLYLFASGAWLDNLIEEVIDAGFMAIVLTVDTQLASRRDRSIELPTPEALSFPLPLMNAAFNDPTFDPSFPFLAGTDWSTVRELQAKINGRVPFGLKGIMTAEDALRAKQEGVDFIWVSNHGGRQLDYAQASIDVLPEIVRAIRPSLAKPSGQPSERWPHFPPGWQHDREAKPQIVIDSGFRRGTDVLQALALGADMVAMGKTFQMALSANGADGVATAYELLAAELDSNLALMGHSSIADLSPADIVRVDYPVARSSPDRAIPELHT